MLLKILELVRLFSKILKGLNIWQNLASFICNPKVYDVPA